MIESLAQIHFTNLAWLYALPALALVLFFLRQRLHGPASWLGFFSQQVYRHPHAERFEQPIGANRIISAGGLGRYGFALLLSTLFLLALAQPYVRAQRLPDPPEHRDIVFLVDTSVSMILRDYLIEGQRTERMTVMKRVLAHFIDQLQGNRIQLITFSEQAYTMVPLTTDYALLRYQLMRLEPASLTGRSSDISHALLYALQPYRQQTQSTSAAEHPVFVLLSDAHRPARHIDPRAAARLIADHGIHLHTIAIGAASYEAEDRERTTLVYHPTSFSLLEEIAREGNGQFYWAKDQDSLTRALRTINEAERRAVKSQPQYIHTPLYYWPLLCAVVLLLLNYLWQVSKPRARA